MLAEQQADQPAQTTGAEQADPRRISSSAPASAPPRGGPNLKKFSHGFFDPEMAALRKITFKNLGRVAVLSIIAVWTCLPFYWVWKSNRYTNKLTVRIIDRDGDVIGQSVTSGLLSQTNLRYLQNSTAEFPTDADVAKDVVEEGAWAAIVVQPYATANLLAARQAGDANYNGSSVVQVYYAQARQEMAVNSYLLPYIHLDLGAVVVWASAQSIALYLAETSGNASAMGLLAQAPSTVANSVDFTLNNLRPYDQPVAQAITLVGLIHMVIFAFIITMNNNAVREIIGPYLTHRAYLIYRIVAPLTLYLFISFFYSMVDLPFKIQFGAHYTYAGGFFLWAFAIFFCMASLGLATELAITIIGPKFMPFFLIPLIIANVSVASLPHELQPWIYRYGPAMPFFNIGRIVRTIIFDTKNEIAKGIGILLAWMIVSCLTITLTTWLFRRNAVNQHRTEIGENEYDETLPA